MAKIILLSGILISLVIRIFLISQSRHVADIYLMYKMGITFLEGSNPYLSLDFNSYPPLAIYLEAISINISSSLRTEFVTVFKFWPNLADFILGFLIYKFLIKMKTKPVNAALWAIFFLLNPVSIIISSVHGQIDSITNLFVVISVFILTFYHKRLYVYLSAIFLGIALAIKPNPVMLIPLFIFYKDLHLKQKIIYLMLIFSPLILTVFPFLGDNPKQVLFKMLFYSGFNDISFAAVLRSIWYQVNAGVALPLSSELLNASKFVFGTGAIILILFSAGSRNLAKACLAIYLLFLSAYFGIASQYLVWVIPFAILAKERMIFLYCFFGSLALFGFYLFFGPDILFGKLYLMQPYQTKHIYLYFLGNLAFWVLTLVWIGKVVVSYVTNSTSKLSPFRMRLIYFSFLLFMLSLIPMIDLLLKLFTRFTLEI